MQPRAGDPPRVTRGTTYAPARAAPLLRPATPARRLQADRRLSGPACSSHLAPAPSRRRRMDAQRKCGPVRRASADAARRFPAAVRVSGRPILVTGAHRSGTTWVGKMLALAPGVAYVAEPFSPKTPKGSALQASTATSRSSRPRTSTAIETVSSVRSSSGTTLGPKCSRRGTGATSSHPARLPTPPSSAGVGAKAAHEDSIALLSAEWLADSFGMDVVVLIRHPAAFAASLKRLGWKHSFASFIQDGRVPDVARPYEAEIREQAERPGEIMAQAALLWRLLYNAVDGYRERHPDWAFVRRGRLRGACRYLRAPLRPVRARLHAGRARGDRPCERAGKPGRADDAVRGRARQRRQPRPLARRTHGRGSRDVARADAGRLAALIRTRTGKAVKTQRPPEAALLVLRVVLWRDGERGHDLGDARRPVRRHRSDRVPGTLLLRADVVRDRHGAPAVGGVVWTWYWEPLAGAVAMFAPLVPSRFSAPQF